MRKKLLAICAIVLFVLNTGFAFAGGSNESIAEGDGSKYVNASYAMSTLSISGNNAVCTTIVMTNKTSTVNKMATTVYYYKSNGTSIGSNTVTVNGSGTYFSGSTTRKLYSYGGYYAVALVKLYHNSQLLESFTLVTNNATY